MARQPPLDAVVVGGGPAGSAIGRLLAAWGHAVLLVDKPADRSRGLAESLPPSTSKLLAEVGVLEAVERAGFYRTTGNTVWWASRDRRIETFGATGRASGYQVYRPDFDRVLLQSAAHAGVVVRGDAYVRRVQLDGDRLAHVDYEHGGRRLTASCRFVLDCSGRAGIVAKRFRRQERGHRMYALVGVWRRQHGWGLPDETHTLVETYEDGWAWSVPISAATRHVGTMVDGISPRGPRGRALADAYRAELAKTTHLAALLRDAALQQSWACDASLYTSHVYGGPQFLLVGDAGSFIDPLSSFGVKKALASAWVGAVAVHTCLTHPDRQTLALDFFSNREQQVYATNLQRSCEFAREAYARHPHPFWAERAEADVESANGDIDDDALFRAPDVQAAFRRLKDSPAIELSLSKEIVVKKRALIHDREIVLDEALSLPEAPEGIRFIAGVDLLKLGEMACRHHQVPDLFEAYCRTYGPVPLPSLLGSLSVLVAKGVLTAR